MTFTFTPRWPCRSPWRKHKPRVPITTYRHRPDVVDPETEVLTKKSAGKSIIRPQCLRWSTLTFPMKVGSWRRGTRWTTGNILTAVIEVGALYFRIWRFFFFLYHCFLSLRFWLCLVIFVRCFILWYDFLGFRPLKMTNLRKYLNIKCFWG